MPFAATWIDLVNLFTKQKQTWRMNLWLPGGSGGAKGRFGVWD